MLTDSQGESTEQFLDKSASESSHRNVIVLIPAFNPDDRLPQLIDDLLASGFGHIVVVNDGSSAAYAPLFEKIGMKARCQVLRHAVNLGKGRALKTGLNHILLQFLSAPGVVTCDADGQHRVEDVITVAQTLLDHPGSLTLGVRSFSSDVPLRSKLGNVITRGFFFFLLGKYLSDTQTGLRGIPLGCAPWLAHLEGEGYEYEMNMLIATKTRGIAIVEEKISTIYLDNNKSSHFDPLIDSMKIYFLLLRFASSSLLASVLDFVLFSITYGLTANILLSIFIGRYTIGPVVNYTINRNFVFHHKGRMSGTLVRYYAFATVMGACAYFLIKAVSAHLSISVIAAKISVETFLFIISFTVQRDYIFSRRTSYIPGTSGVPKG